MSERYPTTLNQAGSAKRDTIGVSGLEARIDEIETQLDGITENLQMLQTRLYPPRPSPVSQVSDAAISPSIENHLNRVINRLQALRALSNELLHG